MIIWNSLKLFPHYGYLFIFANTEIYVKKEKPIDKLSRRHLMNSFDIQTAHLGLCRQTSEQTDGQINRSIDRKMDRLDRQTYFRFRGFEKGTDDGFYGGRKIFGGTGQSIIQWDPESCGLGSFYNVVFLFHSFMIPTAHSFLSYKIVELSFFDKIINLINSKFSF